jgi:tetratricopeptide (TPR) repeat protein
MLDGMKQWEKALQLQLDALELDPYNARIHFEIGSLHLQLKQLDQARASLQSSLDIEPLQPNAYLRLGMIALDLGDGVEYLQQSLRAMEVDSRDHEIPGFIAAFLYQLNLIEEGDDFRNRVLAIAPTSTIAYRIDLLRAINTGDTEAALAAARKAIEDGVEDRQFAHGAAIQFLMRSAARSGTVEAVSAYLEQHAPGILDIDAEAVPIRFLTAQQVAFDAWFTILDGDELNRRIEKIQEIAGTYGVDLLQNPETRVTIMAMRGESEEAIELALSDVFSQPVLADQGWRRRYSQAQYAEFVADPRIQAAMQKWEAEEGVIRDQVRSYLLDLSGAS